MSGDFTLTLHGPVTPRRLVAMVREGAPHMLLPEDARPPARPAELPPAHLPVAAVAEMLRRRHPVPLVAPGDRLVGRAEAAAILRIDPKQVTALACQGRLRAAWTPGGRRRYRESDVLKLRDVLWPPAASA